MSWINLDYPSISEGWAFPTYESKRSHYFRAGRSLCGKWAIPASIRVAGRLNEGVGDDCLTCTRMAMAEVARDWCEHQDPPGECVDCADDGGQR